MATRTPSIRWLFSELQGPLALLVGIIAAMASMTVMRQAVYNMSFSRLDIPSVWDKKDLSDGLPCLEFTRIFQYEGIVYFQAPHALCCINANGKCKSFPGITKHMFTGEQHSICADNLGVLWMASGNVKRDGVMTIVGDKVKTRCEGFFSSIAPALDGGIWAGRAFSSDLFRISERGAVKRISLPKNCGTRIIGLLDQEPAGLLVVGSRAVYRYNHGSITCVRLVDKQDEEIAFGDITPRIAVDGYGDIWVWSSDKLLTVSGTNAVWHSGLNGAIQEKKTAIMSPGGSHPVNTDIWSTDGKRIFLGDQYLDASGWHPLPLASPSEIIHVQHQWITDDGRLLLATDNGILAAKVSEVIRE